MDTPDDIDGLLRELRRRKLTRFEHIADEDTQFIEYVLGQCEKGSKGIVAVLHPNNKMQYILIGVDHDSAVDLLVKILIRVARNPST